MNSSLWPAFFGSFLLAFILVAGVSLLFLSALPRLRRPVFFILQTASLVFVLAFVVREWPRSEEAQFAEMAQYYTLDALADKRLWIGDSSDHQIGGDLRKADYILDRECRNEMCFRGLVEIRCEQGKSSKLSWKADGVNGTFRLRKPASGVWKFIPNFIRDRIKTEENEVVLESTSSRFEAEWQPPRPPTGASRLPLKFTILVELDSPDAPPRFIIEHPRPRIIELPNQRNTAGKIIDTVYLTTEPAAALQADNGDFLPTLTVSGADPTAEVNAYLQLTRANTPTAPNAQKTAPQSGGDDDFIINKGLARTGYRYGQHFDLGGERGIVAAIAARGGLQRWQMISAVLLLWLLPLLFYLPLANQGKLFVLLPLIQILLAVRFVLGLRVYLWPPYSAESLEGGILAAALIPLLIFTGCFAFGLHGIGSLREQEGWRSPWWTHLRRFDFPPFVFYLATLLNYLLLSALLKPPSSIIIAKPQELNDWPMNFAILALLPMLIWRVGLQLDRRLRQAADNDGGYSEGADDPFIHKLICRLPRRAVPRGRLSLPFAVWLTLAAGIGFFALWILGSWFTTKWVIASLMAATGVAGLIWRILLNRLAFAVANPDGAMTPESQKGRWRLPILPTWLRRWFREEWQTGQHTISVALYNLGWVIFFASLLMVAKGVWNLAYRYLGLSALGFNAATRKRFFRGFPCEPVSFSSS